MIAIIDYKLGNVYNVKKCFMHFDIKVEITENPRKIKSSSAIVLPGVGAFGNAIKNLKNSQLFDVLIDEINKGKPFLGICLGMQLLFDKSEESKGNGLNFIKGNVIRFENNLKVPHVGWNSITKKRDDPLLKGINDGDFFYFVHSYYVKPIDTSVISCETEYGIYFPSMVNLKNVWGVQFHPEKSQKNGLKLIENFIKIVEN